jgi:O-antigen/teichoic acid export membrane protein
LDALPRAAYRPPIAATTDVKRDLIYVDAPIYTRGRARRSLIDSAAFRVVSQIATALSYVVLVRGLHEQQFGVYSLLYSFIPFIGTVLSLGLEQVMQRYQPEYLRAGNRAGAAWLVRTIARGRFAANVTMLIVVLLAWNYIAPLFKLAPYRGLFACFGFLILLSFQSRILQLALGSHMMHRYSVGATSVVAVFKLAAYAVLFFLGRLTLETAIAVDTVGFGCAYVSMRLIYQRQCLTGDARLPYSPQPAERKRLFRYGVLNNFNDAGVLLLYSTVDNFFIAAYLDTLSVGIYSFYSRLRQMVLNALPVKLFENIIQPLFFSIPSEKAAQQIPKFFSFLLNMNLLLQWPALAFATAFHSEIVQVIFGGKFIDHSWLLPVLMAFGTLNAVADPVSLVAQYEEKAGIILLSKIFAGYNILAMVILVPFLGVYGAALAGGSAQSLKNAFIWWHVRKSAKWLNARSALLFSVGLWGVAVAACFGLRELLPNSALLRLLSGAIVFMLVGLIYTRGPVLSSSDREILRSLIGEKVSRIVQRVGLLPSQI